jgi:hypothetical protein
MEKIEIYDVLKEDGARLKPANFYTQEQLEELYVERFNANPDGDENSTPEDPQATQEQLEELDGTIHTLFFENGGWCEELQKSFAPGYYRPATTDEYIALKKYSLREV